MGFRGAVATSRQGRANLRLYQSQLGKIIVNCQPWLENILKWPSCETAKNHFKLNLCNIVGENIEMTCLK